MSSYIHNFASLKKRSNDLIEKYIQPTIEAENAFIKGAGEQPHIDFDSFAAFRLLTHAELEGYFEARATEALNQLDAAFKSDSCCTNKFAALIFLYIWQNNQKFTKTTVFDQEQNSQFAEKPVFKNLAQQALGYGRKFIEENNGIKENSIYILSSLMGYFQDQLDDVLVTELNQYGKRRGDVAHKSWLGNDRIFTSAQEEKDRLLKIIDLIENFYEKDNFIASDIKYAKYPPNAFSYLIKKVISIFKYKSLKFKI
jgi:hypothetical protein